MRHNTLAENQENPPPNTFNIMDFTPREKSPTTSMIKKKNTRSGMAGSKKMGAIIGFDEEEEDPNFDEFLADYEKKKKETENEAMTEHKLHELEKANLELEIKTLIKIKDTQSPENSQSSKSSRMNKSRSKPRRR